MTQPPEETRPAVLVIDDDPDMQRWVTGVLQPAGYRVQSAADALTGVMAVRSFHPDLIVLDLAIPGGGGKIFLERLRHLSSFQQTPVLVLSGRLTAESREQLTPLGVIEFLEKPINPASFVRAVHAAVTSEPKPEPPSPA